MILKISLIRAKVGFPTTLVKRKRQLHALYFPQNTLMLTESHGEFSDLPSIFRLRALRYQPNETKKLQSLAMRTKEAHINKDESK